MKITKKSLLASASLAMFGLAITSPAQAFDKVDWSWNKEVTSVEDINLSVNDTFDWSGLVEIEKIQANIGDVSATSTVSGISNNPPGVNADGTVNIDEVLTVTSNYNKPIGTGNTVGSSGGGVTDDPNGVLHGMLEGGNLSEQQNAYTDILDVHITGAIDLSSLEGAVNDGVDLPSVVSAATAVANNQSIDSTAAVNLHDAQYNFGGFNSEFSADPASVELLGLADATDNSHTDAALGLTLAGALGIITPGSVDATSTVDSILNASVDSSATAVANNMSVNIEPTLPGDAFMVADLTQFNYADVTAVSSVTNVDVNNYANLGVLEGPMVKSTATAVGNNVSISVGNLTP